MNRLIRITMTNRNYTEIDLKQIDFDHIPEEYQNNVFKPTARENIKYLASAAEAMPSLVFTDEAK